MINGHVWPPYEAVKWKLAQFTGERIAEPAGFAPRPVDERVVQFIWNEQLLDQEKLITCSGKKIRVLDPGSWNGEAGPDFRNCRIEIDGRAVRGDIEIHVRSTDWDRHQHQRDFEYNGVVLHAFLQKTDGANWDELHNGTRIERLELINALNPDLETITRTCYDEELSQTRAESGSGRCQEALSRVPPELLRRFFTEAGRQRMETKIARLASQLTHETADQVLYQSIMTAMGYKGGKTLFFLLAKRVPIEELKTFLRAVPMAEVAEALEAILLNVANLIPRQMPESRQEEFLVSEKRHCVDMPYDAETQEYLNRTNRWWSEFSGYYLDRVIPPTRRWFASVRPVNFPTRRIAGVARLLAHYDFRRGLVDVIVRQINDARNRSPKSARDFKREISQLSKALTADATSYWATRYTVGGRRTSSNMKLIGDDRGASVYFNAVMPMLFLHARQHNDSETEEFLWRIYEHFPALPGNAVGKYMRNRLFGSDGGGSVINFRLEKSEQALLQIFSDCCSNKATACDECALSTALTQPKSS